MDATSLPARQSRSVMIVQLRVASASRSHGGRRGLSQRSPGSVATRSAVDRVAAASETRGMAKKKDAKDGDVISLDDARNRRRAEEAVAKIKEISAGVTDRVAEIVAVYRDWEAHHPDKAILPVDKLEMITFGFVGTVGLSRCREEHRLPGSAIWGTRAGVFLSDEELAQNVMCPALESGRCLNVQKVFGCPACIMLGAELQQAIAPRAMSGLEQEVLDERWSRPMKGEKARFARAKKLVTKYDKLEQVSEDAIFRSRGD